MRINIYSEELTERSEVVTRTAYNTGHSYVGLRFYLKTHEDMIPPNHEDDDSNAVTFWVEDTHAGRDKLYSILGSGIDQI